MSAALILPAHCNALEDNRRHLLLLLLLLREKSGRRCLEQQPDEFSLDYAL